jgi:hypothetical protein
LGSEKFKKSVDEIKKSVEKVGSAVSDTMEKVNETTFVKESKEKVRNINTSNLLLDLYIRNI